METDHTTVHSTDIVTYRAAIAAKNQETSLNNPLCVDNWSVQHVENPATGDTELVETYTGPVQIFSNNRTKISWFHFISFWG